MSQLSFPGLESMQFMLDHVANFRFVLKDREHRYVYVNSWWLKSVGFTHQDEVIGKTATDVFPAWRAERYIQEERDVMEKGVLLDYEELVASPDGSMRRCRTLKAPWMKSGEVAGMVNIGVMLEVEESMERRADAIPQIVKWMEKHACEPHTVDDIARQTYMSRRSLERYFLEKTGSSPASYRLQCRLDRAKHLLTEGGGGITDIALACGFCDQSHFTRTFRKRVGVTPAAFRNENRVKEKTGGRPESGKT